MVGLKLSMIKVADALCERASTSSAVQRCTTTEAVIATGLKLF